MQPFGVCSVSPRPDEILVRVPEEFLPDVLHAVMPYWAAEDDARQYPQVYGIPGLRARYEPGRGILYRPGFPGRITIPATPGLWRKAVFVAADFIGGAAQIRQPGLSVPDEWHPGEVRFTEAYAGNFSPDGGRYQTSGVESRILRRLPGLCRLPRARWHDLWVNHHKSPAIQFEWEDGPACAAVLDRLLDPEFGPGAKLELLDGQAETDCYSGTASRVKVCSTSEPGSSIMLRRVLTSGTQADILGRSLVASRCAERDAVERAHRYWTFRTPPGEPAPAC